MSALVAVSIVAGVLALSLLVIGVYLVTGRPRRWNRESQAPTERWEPSTTPAIPDGCIVVDENDRNRMISRLDQLTGDLAAEKEAHKAEIAAVQQGAINAMQEFRSELELEFEKTRSADRKSSNARSRQALVAKIGEHLAPLLAGFPFNFKEVRHMGEVFDYLVFNGLEDPTAELEIVFLEIKTKAGRGRTSNVNERRLKEAVDSGRVRYVTFSPDVTNAKNAT
jgi:predicted Holliday junction resolvase-like endonuclease